MLKDNQGDAPMRAFDTTIVAKAYIRGFVDSIVTHLDDVDEEKLLNEFKINKTMLTTENLFDNIQIDIGVRDM